MRSKLFKAIGMLLIAGGGFAGISYALLVQDLPRLDTIKDYHPPLVTSIYDSQGELIGELYKERRVMVPYSAIPPYAIEAFVAAEDARFFEHRGVDLISIGRALFKDILAGEIVQGGSTITQQVTKSILLTPERSFIRKAKEAILAYRIEKRLSKEEILYLYLNQIYFGHGAYGIEAAAQHYFGKGTRSLTLSEATLLAGLPKAPSRYSPILHPDRAKRRQGYVLRQMVKENYITEDEAAEAFEEPLRLKAKPPKAYREAPYLIEHIRSYLESRYGEETVLQEGLQVTTTLDLSQQRAAEKAIRKGLEELDKRQGYRGPLDHIEPTDWKRYRKGVQEELEKSVSEYLLHPDGTLEPISWEKQSPEGDLIEGEIYTALVIEPSREKSAHVAVGEKEGFVEWSGWEMKPPEPEGEEEDAPPPPPPIEFRPGDMIQLRVASKKGGVYRFTLYQEPFVEGSLISLDPNTGEVRAMVGGWDFNRSQFNRATQALRQPGSAFKPIIYAAALDQGMTAASVILDTPIVYNSPEGESTWKPENYDEKFIGEITLRDALAHSRNSVSIKLLEKIGVRYAIQYARKLGIQSPLAPDLTLALGSSSVTLEELCQAYAVFASGGRRITPIYWKRITDKSGRVLEEIEVIDRETEEVKTGPREKPQKSPTGIFLRRLFPNRTSSPLSLKHRSEPTQVIRPQTAYIMTELLKDVIEHGTGWRARALRRPAAGKTGTTNELHDAWFVGYTPDLLTGVWVGFDQRAPLGKQETGSRAASPIWLYYMQEALKGKPPKDFAVPDGIVFAKIDLETGLLATPHSRRTAFLPFKEGTAPTKSSDTRRDIVDEELLKYGL